MYRYVCFALLLLWSMNLASSISTSRLGKLFHQHLLDASSTSSSRVGGVWTCSPAGKAYDNKENMEAVAAACKELTDSKDFWIYGHAGHYPMRDRNEKDKDQVARYLCTVAGRKGTMGVVALQKKEQELPLVCLHPDLRGSKALGESVDLLNAALMLKGGRVSWISSNADIAVNFYKSLQVDCECADFGRPGKPTYGWKFAGTAPVAKKVAYYVDTGSNTLKRVVPDMCMSAADFTNLINDLGEHVVQKAGRYTNTEVAKETLPLSDLVNTHNLDQYKNNPTHCKNN